ncbi:Tm-1-like ATP-binding domain-containing protein [Haloplanus halophilus]|uniref:Tm-1-like ATP-binding domain-containing protein n=1 Tax=Haloplanus halophilus TaxID=2949993 RepID=UPI00203FEAFB|nr:Tm-1-like ATP-binding domain-containing protein [Haloplanus sp. GDY1]
MSIVIVGTLDTKEEPLGFAREVMERAGAETHVVDAGVLGDPGVEPDTTAATVAAAGDASLDALRTARDRSDAMAAMGRGAARIVTRLHAEGRLDAVFGLGGSGNTSVASRAMRALPVGVPKLIVSTMASGNVAPYVGTRDVAMLHSVVDIEGLDPISRTVVENGARAVVGMTGTDASVETDRPTVAITMFGVTTPCVRTAREYLDDRGYETLVFHATGTGGRAMEELIADGVVDGVLDVTTTELTDELAGGVLSAGPDRLRAAGRRGIPQVVVPGATDVINFGPPESVPASLDDRRRVAHNPQVTLVRTAADEAAAVGADIAAKLGDATGPTALALPLGGTSELAVEGGPFHDPEADAALFDALRDGIDDDVERIEMATDVNDPAFARRIARRLDAYLRSSGAAPACDS